MLPPEFESPHAETRKYKHVDKIAKYYDLIDVFIFPRLRTRLTEMVTPLKPLEAMAKGRPVIASNVGGHRELICDGRTGIFFEAGDKSSLAAKICYVISNKQHLVPLLRNAREYVEAERQWSSSVRHYENVYDDAIARFSRRSK